MELDYKRLGLKCGIECHQQLEGKKLFCNCPTEIREDTPEFTIKRNLRAVAGESGQIDVAAREEMSKKKDYLYEGYHDNGCLVEQDEMPPNPLNRDALNVVLQVCKMLNAKPVDGVQVMRKTVVDGSNTAGFQRTALVGINGILETSEAKLGIPTVIIEEDACRTIKEDSSKVVFRLDRLGIPLVEICTTPGIKTPEGAREAAEKLGMMLRSTGKAKRGLGTIRQDVNVSIKEGERVEIKGAQDLKSIPKLVENEMMRQANLVLIKKELSKRNVKESSAEIIDVTDSIKNSGSKIIKDTVEAGKKVLGIRLVGFKSLIGKEVQPGRRLGTEMADRARVITGVGGIFHSDELPAYGITDREVEMVDQSLRCGKEDAFVLVADAEDKARKALIEVIRRANDAVVGVPMEVRKANKDNTTSYERPMPGSARMYPETDIPPIRITSEMWESVSIPELISDKASKYEKMGLSKDLAKLTSKSVKASMFEEFVAKHPKIKAAYIAEIVMTSTKIIKRQFNIEINPTEKDYDLLFSELSADKISKENVLEILKENKPVAKVISKYQMISDADLEKELKEIVSAHKGLAFNALIGEAMKKLRGKAPGKKISEMLKKMVWYR